MIGIFLLGIVLVMTVWQISYQKNWDKQLRIWLAFEEQFVYAGEQAHLAERIENRKRLPVPVLEVSFRMRKELLFHDMENTAVSDLTNKRDIFSLLGNQRITRRLKVDCTRRGKYDISGADIRTFSMLFKKEYRLQIPAEATLYVYAKRENVSGILTSCEKMMGMLQCEKRLYEDPYAFASIREYTITDPMKTINWKASARTGGLMVNTFESTQTRKVMIYLDVEDEGIIKYTNLTEHSISVAATLIQKLINRGMEAGLAMNCGSGTQEGVWLSPRTGKQHQIQIEQILAEFDSRNSKKPFAEILTTIPADAVPVFISKNQTPENRKAMETLCSSERGIWVLPYDKYQECREVSAKNLTVIRREVADR